jgi:hypothetical protein
MDTGPVWMDMQQVIIGGIIVQTFLFMIGGYALIIRNDESRKILTSQINDIQDELRALAKVTTQIAVQSIRLDNMAQQVNLLDKRVDDLRRGEGFIITPYINAEK